MATLDLPVTKSWAGLGERECERGGGGKGVGQPIDPIPLATNGLTGWAACTVSLGYVCLGLGLG